MISRREFLHLSAATALALGATAPLHRAAAQQRLRQDDLLRFDAKGQVTLLHMADIHGQLLPVWLREPSLNIGVAADADQLPHITGKALLERYGLAPDSLEAYMLTPVDFEPLSRAYGRVGGLDRVATLIKAIRAERDGRTLLLEGGDSLQGSWGALQTRGGDMARALRHLGVEATVGHWEFTYGEDRVLELAEELGCPFLAANINDAEWDEPVFEPAAMFERGGVQIAVIGQAFPYTPIANPRWMMPNWSFGIREEAVRAQVAAARAAGAGLVVLLSHNGFDLDRAMAQRVEGIDVILTAHTHDVLMQPLQVGNTLLVASGSHGKFLSRLDLDIAGGRIRDYSYRLIPVVSDAIEPDAETTALVEELRAPWAEELGRVVGRTRTTLYRRGNLNGTWDDVILDAIMTRRDAEIGLSPGFRWGPALPAGQDIRMDDIYSQTAITYPEVYRSEMTGEQIKTILEDVADNLFHPDPYYRQGGDMVRVGGLGFTIDPTREMGRRIADLVRLPSDEPLEASKTYTVAGWASVNEGTEGPPAWELLAEHIREAGELAPEAPEAIRFTGI